MRRGPFLHFLAAVLAGLGCASAAEACFYTAPACVGDDFYCNPTPRERRAQERAGSQSTIRWLSSEGQRRLRAGEVDVAAELAELLMPNVRPVFVSYSDCGPMGEFDYGRGSETGEGLFRALVEDSPLASLDPDEFPRFLRGAEQYSFGAPCNAEFRSTFANYVRGVVDPRQLEQAWLFLNARRQGDRYQRLVRFRGDGRTPPVEWEGHYPWLTDQLERFARRRPAGRAIAAAVARFWSERGTELDDDSKVCPLARVQWQQARDEALAGLSELHQERETRRAARAATQR